MQNLLLRQQAGGGNPAQHSHAHTIQGNSTTASQLRSLALAGLSGLSTGSFMDNASLGGGQYHSRHEENENVSGNLSLAQRLLAYQQQQQQQPHQQQQRQLHVGGVSLQGTDAQALDALSLLARSAPRSGTDVAGNGNDSMFSERMGGETQSQRGRPDGHHPFR